jgi:ferredoxin--NADP+ reductase
MDAAKLADSRRPSLRIAIIGSGPAGFYSVERLFEERDLAIRVDMFDRLATPFGLVRSGVAPDHPRIKSVINYYNKLARDPRFRFFGDIEFGTEVTIDDLRRRFHVIIFACGAQADRTLGIPGEKLEGVHSARQFVAWYNGAPDYSHLHFDLSGPSAVVIGSGNVAADVARILCRTPGELAHTDIADHALQALSGSRISHVSVIGRRGPAQTRFSLKTIRELSALADTVATTEPKEMELDAASRAETNSDPQREKIVQTLRALAAPGLAGKHKALRLRFLLSPVEILGDEQGRVAAVRCVRNELYRAENGSFRPRATDRIETLKARLVFRAVGYRGVSLPGLPFVAERGVIPNELGRITDLDSGRPLRGLYVSGWIKRGPQGLVGASKADARETVECLLDDARRGQTLQPTQTDLKSVDALLRERGLAHVTYSDWMTVDKIEQERGRQSGRPRVKFTKTDEIYRVISQQNK